MYKLFSTVNFIQTNEREHKLFYKNNNQSIYKKIDKNKINLFNKNEKKKSCEEIFLNIRNTKLRTNWKPFHRRRAYFSKPKFLISTYDY